MREVGRPFTDGSFYPQLTIDPSAKPLEQPIEMQEDNVFVLADGGRQFGDEPEHFATSLNRRERLEMMDSLRLLHALSREGRGSRGGESALMDIMSPQPNP